MDVQDIKLFIMTIKFVNRQDAYKRNNKSQFALVNIIFIE